MMRYEFVEDRWENKIVLLDTYHTLKEVVGKTIKDIRCTNSNEFGILFDDNTGIVYNTEDEEINTCILHLDIDVYGFLLDPKDVEAIKLKQKELSGIQVTQFRKQQLENLKRQVAHLESQLAQSN